MTALFISVPVAAQGPGPKSLWREVGRGRAINQERSATAQCVCV